jgi:hypothetical protein
MTAGVFEIETGDSTALPQDNAAVFEPGLHAWAFSDRAHMRIGLSVIGGKEKRYAGSSRRIHSSESGSGDAQTQGRGEKRVTGHKFFLELLSARSADFFTDATQFAAG